MSCPSYIWRKAQSEGVSLSELGRRGALKRAANRRAKELFQDKQLLLQLPTNTLTQLTLFPESKPH